MRRRLEIARGMCIRPRFCSWTSRLSDWTLKRGTIFGWTPRTLNAEERVTVFLTTHYMEEADRVADRIAIIDHGRIVAQGSPGELKRQGVAEL